jgi:hypothetical protein
MQWIEIKRDKDGFATEVSQVAKSTLLLGLTDQQVMM